MNNNSLDVLVLFVINLPTPMALISVNKAEKLPTKSYLFPHEQSLYSLSMLFYLFLFWFQETE